MAKKAAAAPKAAAAKAAPEKPAKKVKPKTKAEIYTHLADKTALSKKQVAGVYEALVDLIKEDLRRKGAGLFQLPGVAKMKVVRKPATKEKQVKNPFKEGEMMTVKAKPARNVIKIVPLKALKVSV